MLFRHFSPWGTQTGPSAAPWANYVIKFSSIWHSAILVLGASKLNNMQPLEPISTCEWHSAILVLGAFKLNNMQSVEPNLGSNFLFNLWMSFKHFSPLGVQIGPSAASRANFVIKFSSTCEWHSGILVLRGFKVEHLFHLQHILISYFLQLVNFI